MSDLLALQRTIAAVVRGNSRAALTTTREGAIPAEARWSVYRNNVRSSLRRALEVTFPATRQCLGEEHFRAAADALVQTSPPTAGWLSAYGREVSAHLARQGAALASGVARIEWAEHLAALAPYESALDLNALLRLPEAELARVRLRPSRSAALVRVHASAFAAWAQRRGPIPSRPGDLDAALLVVRSRDGVRVERISASHAGWATRLETVPRLVDLLRVRDGGRDLASALAALASFGAISVCSDEFAPRLRAPTPGTPTGLEPSALEIRGA